VRVSAPSFVDHDRLRELTRREEERLNASASAAMYRRAASVIAGGVTSSHQVRKPWPLYLSRAAGSSLWDVDGVHRVDYHAGFGAMVPGHPTEGSTSRPRVPSSGRCRSPTRRPTSTHTCASSVSLWASLPARRWSLDHGRSTGLDPPDR
jgi:glutamate-1-semialdehyde 2,1-aminomutase